MWYCSKCGEATGVPDAGTLMDARYAVGRCPCSKRSKVALSAAPVEGTEWFKEKQEIEAEKAAYKKMQSGKTLTMAESRLVVRFRVRNGMPDPERV